MKKSFLKWSTCIAGMLLAFSLTSCVSESDETPEVPTGDGTLVININSSSVGATTRTVTITDGLEAAALTAEKTVSTMAIAIFSSDGATKRESQYLTGLSGTVDGWNTVTGHRGTSITVGDQVLVALNVTEKFYTEQLSQAATAAAFRACWATIDQAIMFQDVDYTAGWALSQNKLPMYGSGTVALTSDGESKPNNFKVDINAIHMLAKVTLNSVSMSNLAATTQFTPTQIFLINVPEKLGYNFVTDGNPSTYTFSGVTANFYQGESEAVAASTNVTTPDPDLTTRQFRDYLGTEALSLSAIDASHPLNTPYTFYTLPNNDGTNDTRLVIKGEWSEDGGTNHHTVWYTIQLKNVSADPSSPAINIYPNHHYKVDVDIQREGAVIEVDDATGAYSGLTQARTVTTTVDVQDWSNGAKVSTFDGNGGNVTES